MIQHNKPLLDKKDLQIVTKNLQSGMIACGETVEKFEEAMTKFLGKGESAAVASGTSALFLALWALGVKENDEVITSTYVCSAVLNAIYLCRATPVLVDIKEDDFNIDPLAVKKVLTKKTKAIIAPHIYGVPADIKALRKFGIPVIEDCAQALGAKVGGQSVGTLSDISIFSFYATKLITTGHGGMVFSRSTKLINRIRDYREFDCRKEYYPRFNFKMTDFQAALGLSQLTKLKSFLAKRESIADSYKKICDGYGVSYQQSGAGSVYYRFVIRQPNIKNELLKGGIKTIIPIEPWELLHRYLKQPVNHFPIAEKIARSTLSLPLYPAMTKAEIIKTTRTLESVVR